ncbi:MAG: hypothetical protein NXI24_22150 [bacterium]|nr:hypothetical protein [bacterium]
MLVSTAIAEQLMAGQRNKWMNTLSPGIKFCMSIIASALSVVAYIFAFAYLRYLDGGIFADVLRLAEIWILPVGMFFIPIPAAFLSLLLWSLYSRWLRAKDLDFYIILCFVQALLWYFMNWDDPIFWGVAILASLVCNLCVYLVLRALFA